MSSIPEIRPEQSIELLKELHILTRDGKINQDTRRKLKQVYHLYQFISPLLEALENSAKEYSIVDHGAGKSYLGFIIYDLFLKQHQLGHMYGIDFRQDLTDKSKNLANKLGFNRMSFINSSVEASIATKEIPDEVEMVTALHACDTATDDAIEFGLKKKAKYFVLVPCCQAEVATCLRKFKNKMFAQTPLSELWRHPIHTRELGSHLTNVLRCLRLESHGYQVTVTELIGWEHSMKNELIIAEFKDIPNQKANDKLERIINEFGLTELNHRFN